jgi:hypothetical protein
LLIETPPESIACFIQQVRISSRFKNNFEREPPHTHITFAPS